MSDGQSASFYMTALVKQLRWPIGRCPLGLHEKSAMCCVGGHSSEARSSR